MALLLGEQAEKDPVEAAKWLRKAAIAGSAQAQSVFAFLLDNGIGLTKDVNQAVIWFRKAAEQGDATAQSNLGYHYDAGIGVEQSDFEALKWFTKAAEQGNPAAQVNLGLKLLRGEGINKDERAAFQWFKLAAERGIRDAQYQLGVLLKEGSGTKVDWKAAREWLREAADQGHSGAQFRLGIMLMEGQGGGVDVISGLKWLYIAVSNGNAEAKVSIESAERQMSPAQLVEGRRQAKEWEPKITTQDILTSREVPRAAFKPAGTGFFVTDDGYFVTSLHVLAGATNFGVFVKDAFFVADLVKSDEQSDLAILKVSGRFTGLPVVETASVRLGSPVATVGFPNSLIQGMSPKLTRGEISSLKGMFDDENHFQISTPVQPGNSGGALVDDRGNVVGVVVGRLSKEATFRMTGSIPENVNYAVKSDRLLVLLNSLPGNLLKIKSAVSTKRNFEDIVSDVENATAILAIE